jgi:hypothetical protein
MNFHELVSDQLYVWSVSNDRTNHSGAQATAQATAAQAAAARRCASRLVDRTLQALWQSQLQVRSRSRPWAQVLPVGELSGPVAADGLRPSSRLRADQRARSQLHPGSRDLGGDLRDQPRTAASTRTTLRRNGEPGTTPVAHRPHRFLSCCDAARQHAGRLYRGRRDGYSLCGGQR